MCVSLYMFITPIPVEDTSFPAIGVGWPVRLFILFGFSWYLYSAISAPRLTKEIIFGILSCSLEVFVAFHKPIVFAGLGCVITMALIQQVIPRKRIRGNVRMVGGIVLLAMTLFAAVQLIGGIIFEKYQEDFQSKFLHQHRMALDEETVTSASGGRFELWDQAIDSIIQHPWVGNGPGEKFEIGGQQVHAHNGYLELLYTVGFIGALAHFAAAWIWLKQTIRAPDLARRARLISPIVVYIGGFLFFEMGGASVEFYTQLTFVYFMMGIALGYSVALQPIIRPRRNGKMSVIQARSY